MKKYILVFVGLLIAMPYTIHTMRRSNRRNRIAKTFDPNMLAVMAAFKQRALHEAEQKVEQNNSME